MKFRRVIILAGKTGRRDIPSRHRLTVHSRNNFGETFAGSSASPFPLPVMRRRLPSANQKALKTQNHERVKRTITLRSCASSELHEREDYNTHRFLVELGCETIKERALKKKTHTRICREWLKVRARIALASRRSAWHAERGDSTNFFQGLPEPHSKDRPATRGIKNNIKEDGEKKKETV